MEKKVVRASQQILILLNSRLRKHPLKGLRPNHQQGFSLLEILVVVVILGIAATIVAPNVALLGEDDKVNEELRRLNALIGMASERALIENTDWGLVIEEDSYQFQHFVYSDKAARQRVWQDVEGSLFRQRSLDESLRFELKLVQAKKAQSKLPSVLLYASGESNNFEIFIKDKNDSNNEASLASDGYSALTLNYAP